MIRYLTEFRTAVAYPGTVTDWQPPNAPLATSLDEVAALIGEYSDQATGYVFEPADKMGTIRVTQISDEVPARDVTEDALLHYGRGEHDASGVWPWWLKDIEPLYLKDDAA